MATVTFEFANPINVSAQVGDTTYYVTTSSQGGFTTSLNNSTPTIENTIVEIGTIRSINVARLIMVCNTSLTTGQIPIRDLHFISFSKDSIANTTTALGYYAEVKLRNNSTTEAELFSIGCDVFESSK
jgi:hypothetical protein